jgi:hypothetical protein
MSDIRWKKSPDRTLEFDEHNFVKRQDQKKLLRYMDRNETEKFQTEEHLPHPKTTPAWFGNREAFQKQVLDRPYNRAKRQ